MSKRKKHNPHKRAQRLMGNVRMWSWESEVEDDVRILRAEYKRGFVWLPMTKEDTLRTANKINNWSLILRAILWYPDGKSDVNTVIADFRNVNLAQLEVEAKALRETALKRVQRGHIVDVGWLAISYTDAPRTEGDKDLAHLGGVSIERQELWNYENKRELKENSND